MKVWNNRKHEEVLKAKREKKKELLAMSKRTPYYDTSCIGSNGSLEPSTATSRDFSTNKRYYY